jgi:hypothetical protein
MEPFVISDCLFVQNSGLVGGGMSFYGATNQQVLIVTNCQFYQNRAGQTEGTGGGGLNARNAQCFIENCIVAMNSSAAWGGGMTVLRPATARIERSEVFENSATKGGAGLYMYDGSPTSGDLKVELLQSVFWGNSTPGWGGAIWAAGTAASSANKQRLYILNSCIVSNTATLGGAAFVLDFDVGWIENSILWGNPLRVYGAGSSATVRTTCLAEAATYPGNGNINADPKFVDSANGNLRLQSGSPCIDHGNNYEDYDMLTPGFQPLPATDMDGNWRIADGNKDGTATVDMGTYEYQ